MLFLRLPKTTLLGRPRNLRMIVPLYNVLCPHSKGIENVYGHTIDQRTRAWNEQKLTLPEVVEFRIEDHKDALEERLLALR